MVIAFEFEIGDDDMENLLEVEFGRGAEIGPEVEVRRDAPAGCNIEVGRGDASYAGGDETVTVEIFS